MRGRERGYMPLVPSLGGVACALFKYGQPNTEGLNDVQPYAEEGTIV